MVLIAALLDALIRAYRLSKKHTLDELAALSWQQSEEAIADAFCRHWYVHPDSAFDGGGIADTTAADRSIGALATQRPAAPIDGDACAWSHAVPPHETSVRWSGRWTSTRVSV
jgi:hypothetical protein